MKKHIAGFLRRGATSCGLGPIVLAVIYLFMKRFAFLETLTVEQVCVGIISTSVLAFIAGGMNFLYQIEKLPLTVAISIHGGVLYVSYLVTYLLNNWLVRGIVPILVFTGIFVISYPAIWLIIYSIAKRNTKKINEVLQQKQQNKTNCFE